MTSSALLTLEGVEVSVEGHPIVQGVDLEIGTGEIHAIMGPNGSGKSTLSKALAGHPGYPVTGGRILFRGEDIAGWAPHERALKGIFLGFQYPLEIPGVGNAEFLRTAYNARRKAAGLPEVDPLDFDAMLDEKMSLLKMEPKFKDRFLNEGFSGGEKKLNEVLQLAVLEPALAVLDETDSGLDIDALRVVAEGINGLRGPGNAFVLITHYQRLLEYVVPDRVHVLAGGRLVRSGGRELALELERKGYEWVTQGAAGA